MNKKDAAKKADDVLQATSYTIPVDVDAIAVHYGIRVKPADLEDDISGMLVFRDDRAVIGVNKNHSATRQRFTKAHEIGHYFLHKGDGKVFVDDKRVKFRDPQSSTGTSLEEIHANAFAAELLMPASDVRKYAHQLAEKNMDAEAAVWELANVFEVSEEAMKRRLTDLGFEVD